MKLKYIGEQVKSPTLGRLKAGMELEIVDNKMIDVLLKSPKWMMIVEKKIEKKEIKKEVS